MEATADARQDRGLAIATSKRIVRRGPVWVVPSATHSGSYVVSSESGGPRSEWSCSCPDYEARHLPCKHVIAVEIVRFRELPDGTKVTEAVRVTYAQDWPKYNAAQVNEKERFALLLRELCNGLPRAERRGPGRPRTPVGDLVFSAAMKVYSTQSGRRASTDLREAAHRGLVAKATHYNTISDGLGNADLTPILKSLIEQSAAPLAAIETDFAVDSTGMSTCQYQRWFDVKHGGEKTVREWRKLHATVGVVTNVVTACEVTSAHDATQLPAMLATTARTFDVKEVSADKAYSSHRNVQTIVRLGAAPFIPFRSNTGSGVDAPASWKKLFHLFCYRNDEFRRHYHKRSNVETAFHMIKSKFGAAIRSKTPTAQTNQILLKVLAHNICCLISAIYELGLEPELGRGI